MPLNEPIYIYDYEPRWPKLAKQHTDALAAALGDKVVQLEHIGSTAVPGLAAKPILDLILGHRNPGLNPASITLITELGFTFYGEAGVPQRGFFRREPTYDGEPPVHLHVFPEGHPALSRDVSFRDALRADPALAHRYAVLKRALALRNRNDLEGYNAGKEEFISRVAGVRTAPARWSAGPGTPSDGIAA